MKYEQLLPMIKPMTDGAFRVIPGDYVTTEDGTGIVHIAPNFGADDANVAKKSRCAANSANNKERRTSPYRRPRRQILRY